MSHSNRSPGSRNRFDGSAPFFDQLKFALENFAAPAVLGADSPLAQPYFLGQTLQGTADGATNIGRGDLLCTGLLQAAHALWEGPLPVEQAELLQAAFQAKDERGLCDRYYFLLLDLTYLHQYFDPPRNQSEIYDAVLHVSRATYDRHLREAVRRLGEMFLLRMQPTLRLEHPMASSDVVGRDVLRRHGLATLQAGKSLYLCGVSGIGKSTLGAALAEQWSNPAVFWFTIRYTLNDQLTSLLFALGHFLHQQGSSRLWLQLIANGGVMKDANLALELTRADLADVAVMPLLCFDELDLLRPQDLEKETAAHTQFLAFVEGLQGHAPLLLMGQRNVLPTDAVYTLTRLTTAEIAEWLKCAGIAFTPALLARLDAYTAGNPRLLALCLVLCRTTAAQAETARSEAVPTEALLSTVLDQLPQVPALTPIWQRLQRRLTKAERTLLQALSVFRTPTPRDAWLDATLSDTTHRQPASYTVLQHLLDYRLIYEDGSGGVALLPTLREVIYTQLTVEQREELHRQAAMLRAVRGEYSAAAYHFQQADQPAAAIAIWQPYTEQEIRRGQAAAALAIFEHVSCHRLSEADAAKLRLLRSQLYQLCGQSTQALQEVDSIQQPSDAMSIETALVGGDALRTLGEADAALVKYGEGLAAAARLLQQNIWLHAKRGTVYIQRRELHNARREALLARYRLENLEGAIQETAGNYSAARQHYLAALTAAEMLDDKAGLALVQRNLGVLATHQADAESAIYHHQQALAFYEQIGDRVRMEEVRSNLAAVYVQFGQFEAALAPAQRALAFFEARQNSYWIAQNTSNLATVHFEMGDLTQAQHYAERTLDQEEAQSYPYALFTLGQVRRAQKRWEEAGLFFDRVRQIAERNEDKFLLSQLQEVAEEVH
ncbi:MAG: tetratricopeptide repeat protein [Caldilineaceae bacterium]